MTATARKFTVAPNTLTNLSQTNATGAQIRATAPGIGVNGGGDSIQLDTNNRNQREAILFSSNVPRFSLRGFKLSAVDNDDTLQIYGVAANGALTPLGFAGVIKSMSGATVTNTTPNLGTAAVTLSTPTAEFQRYLFTTRVGGEVTFMGTTGQGYRIDSLMGSTVPEPGTWAMLIVGFGLVGVVGRRRQRVVAA